MASPVLSLLILFTFGAPAKAAPGDPAPCIGALARVWAPAFENSWVGGALPRVVKYNRPHQDLLLWKRRDGTLLVLDGKGVQQVPAFGGAANGITFMRDPRAVAERILAPSTYRKVALADGRTFELHRLGEAGHEATLLRGEAEDAEAIAFEEDRQRRRSLLVHEKFAEHFARLEKVCESSERRFSELSFAEQLGGILNGIVNSSRPDFVRGEPNAAVRAEERFLEMDVEAIRDARARKGTVEGWRRDLEAMAPEREKETNRLLATPMNFDAASTADLLKEATADFEKHVRLSELTLDERKELAACEGFLELPPVKDARAKNSLLEIGARATLPIEYALLMNFYQRLQLEQQSRANVPSN